MGEKKEKRGKESEKKQKDKGLDKGHSVSGEGYIRTTLFGSMSSGGKKLSSKGQGIALGLTAMTGKDALAYMKEEVCVWTCMCVFVCVFVGVEVGLFIPNFNTPLCSLPNSLP